MNADDVECNEACSMLLEEGPTSAELDRFGRLDARQQRQLYREVRRLARGYRREGYPDDQVADRVTQKIAKDPQFESILGVLLLAALAATVQFWIKKLWERWFPEGPGRRAAFPLTIAFIAAWLAGAIAVAAPPVFDDISSLDGEFLFDQRWSDGSPLAEVASPLTANPALEDFDFTCFSVARAVGNGVTRSPWSGMTLVSPSVAVHANHVPSVGTNLVWRDAEGVEYTRHRIGGSGPLPGATHTDYGVTILNAPLPAAITPAKILADSSWLDGEDVAVLECDYHINVMKLGIAQPGSITNDSSTIYVSRPSADGDAIEGGDSGKPGLVFIEGEPVVVLTALHIAFAAGSPSRDVAAGPNPSHDGQLASLRSVVESRGEELAIVIDSDPPPDPEGPPLGVYQMRGPSNQQIVVGGTPIAVEVE